MARQLGAISAHKRRRIIICTITGFSLAPGSQINARELTHALLSFGEMRGTDSAGFAWAKADGTNGMHKAAITGSQLPLTGLPKNASTVIAHNRMSTKGSPKNNHNNHPVIEPSGRIRAIHNGHIFNDEEVKSILKDGNSLAEVDSSVLAGVLAEMGTAGTSLLAGDAAVAWLDSETSNTLHLAKLSHSPVAIARLLDGSFVFASTEQILARALMSLKLKWITGTYPDTFVELRDGDYLTITDGNMEQQDDLEWYDDYSFYSGHSDWRAITSGSTIGKPSEDKWRRAWEIDDDVPGHFDDDGVWVDEDGPQDGRSFALDYTGPAQNDKFYAVDHDGDYSGFATIENLVNTLRFSAGLTGAENLLISEGPERWVNHYLDVGEVLEDGELQSWVADPTWLEDYDAASEEPLEFIAEGLSILRMVLV